MCLVVGGEKSDDWLCSNFNSWTDADRIIKWLLVSKTLYFTLNMNQVLLNKVTLVPQDKVYELAENR